jgi:predicted nucleic acid-binding protein
MNVVDSSAWLEYFANGPNAQFFAPAIEDSEQLLVPTLILYDVFKRVLQQTDENKALQAAATIQQGRVLSLNGELALSAARISMDNRLPMADSIILATTRAYDATLWTQDEGFKGLEGVKYRRKKS